MLVNVDRLQSNMDLQGLDGLVATTQPNVYYLSGIWSLSLNVFPYDGQCYAIVERDRPTEPHIVASTGEIDQVLDSCSSIRGTTTFGTFYRELPDGVELNAWETQLRKIAVDRKAMSSPLDALVDAVTSMGLADKKIGVDELNLPAGFLEALQDRLPRAHFFQATALFQTVRQVKTPDEVQRLRAAARTTEQAIRAAISIAGEGVTEQELAREFERSIVSQGAQPNFTLIRVGRNAVGGQIIPDRTPLRRGDTIWFDVGCILNGYCSDIARVFSFGEPTEKVCKYYEAMVKGLQRGFEQAQAGMSAAQLFDLMLEGVRQSGVAKYRRHHLGHGIGTEVYEPPLLAPEVEGLIENGMVLNVETPYYEFGLGAMHVEDPFLVSSKGNQWLTTMDQGLQIID